MKDNKENDIKTILLYNIKVQEMLNEIAKIKDIFREMNVEVEFHETTDEEDILVYPALITFIKIPDDIEKIEKINEYIEIQRGWTISFIVNNDFFIDMDKLKTTIKDYYEESKNLKVMYEVTEQFIYDGIMGFAVGDALGVPSEFKTREELQRNSITEMVGDGTYNVPKGTWSDDTSMTLATMDSISKNNRIDTNDMATRFLEWFRKGKYTATGEAFDIGRTTLQSLAKFEIGVEDAENCGQTGEMDNGNGSLMRMLPIAYYIWFVRINEEKELEDKDIYEIVKRVSSITHKHEISIMGCYIFVKYALEIMEGKYKEIAYENIKRLDYSFFSNETIEKYNRILQGNIKEERIENIESTGYIVHTLEAVLWLFLNGKDYNSTILKAVNLGGDTDTIAAITGGLLGIHYGAETIKEEWKNDLIKKDYIKELCGEFFISLYKDVYSLINSKAISKYCREIQHEFNTEEIAVLIYRNKNMNIEEKIKAYENLIENYPDMEVIERINCKCYDSVKEMIEEEIKRLKMLKERFYKSEENSVYTYNSYYNGCRNRIIEGRNEIRNICKTYEDVEKLIAEEIEQDEEKELISFRITKRELSKEDKEGIGAEYKINEERKIEMVNIYDFDNDWVDIGNICINIPTPFKRGDLLMANSKTPFGYGYMLNYDKFPFVLEHLCTWNDDFQRRLAKGNFDSSDMQGPGYLISEEGNLYYDNVFDYDSWEYFSGELEGMERILQTGSSLMKGEIGIDLFIDAYEHFKAEKIKSEHWLDIYTEEGLLCAGIDNKNIY